MINFNFITRQASFDTEKVDELSPLRSGSQRIRYGPPRSQIPSHISTVVVVFHHAWYRISGERLHALPWRQELDSWHDDSGRSFVELGDASALNIEGFDVARKMDDVEISAP